MKLEVNTSYLDPIRINEYEWVTVYMTALHKYGNADDYVVRREQCDDNDFPEYSITVFDDAVYVATADDVKNHRGGKKIWERPKT